MYKISFDTSGFVSKKRRRAGLALLDAKVRNLNGISYEYENLTGPLINRLKFMLCLKSTIDGDSKSNKKNVTFICGNMEYEREMTYQLPGVPTIENDAEEIRRILNKVMKDGVVKVPFSRYYDAHYKDMFKGAYLVIENLDYGK